MGLTYDGRVLKTEKTSKGYGVAMIRKIALGVVLGCVSLGVHSAAGDAAAGQSKTAVCAACHNADGNSSLPTFPKLAGQSEAYLFKQIKSIQSGERPVVEMTGLTDNLSDQDIADISAFYASQPATTGQADPELVELGRGLYEGGNPAKGIPSCMGCHGPAGNGVATAGYPKISGQHATYTTSQLEMFRNGSRNNDPNAMMRGVAANLSDAEIEALSSYIQGLY